MHRRDFLRTASFSALASPLALARPQRGAQAPTAPAPTARGAQAATGGDWIPLWNGRNLDGFYTFLQRSGKDVAQTKGMVTIENGLLHIMGNDVNAGAAESGYIATNAEYENVRIRAEYKWGVKRFAPRLENKRDNGILYYLTGPDRVWPTCLECQIQETDVGDYFMLGGTRAIQGTLPGNGGADGELRDVGAPPDVAAANEAARRAGRGGPPIQPTGGRKIKDGDFENRDDWNTIEIIARGDRSSHIVNGRMVNSVSSVQMADTANAGQFVPLTKGKIAIEIEFAEVWFRRLEIMHLS